MNNRKIYVFDMGRVITKPARLDKMYSMADMNCELSDFKNYFYNSKEADEVYRGLITDDEFFAYIKAITDSNKSVNRLQELYNLCKGGIYLDTIQVIEELKRTGNIVCLLSNLKKIDYDYLSENIDLNLFDKLFLSYQLGMSKPHEDIFRYVINELGTNQFHFFDDSLENIMVAKKLEINAHQTTGDDIIKCLRKL